MKLGLSDTGLSRPPVNLARGATWKQQKTIFMAQNSRLAPILRFAQKVCQNDEKRYEILQRSIFSENY